MLIKDILIIDVETTGIDPISDTLVQLAALILDKKTLDICHEFSMFIRPETTISENAKATHGLDEKTLRHAEDSCTVLQKFQNFAPPTVLLAGHNVSFDVNFLKNAYARCNLSFPFDYHTIDIWSIAFFILGASGVKLETYSLSVLAKYFGISRREKHDALEDVCVSARILKYLFELIDGNMELIRGQLEHLRGIK
jgi:DNA polymerase III epsilon subunit family exonuclease